MNPSDRPWHDRVGIARRSLRRRRASSRGALGIGAAALLVVGATAGYVVAPGDTLSGIARRHDTTTQEIAALNGIADPNRIYAGQSLELPGADAVPGADEPADVPQPPAPEAPADQPPPEAPSPEWATHTVVPGDTVVQIARSYHIGVRALARENGVEMRGTLKVGTVLWLPGVSAAGDPPTGSDAPGTYLVQPGDSLSRIAARFHVSVRQLVDANDLVDPNHIVVGSRLLVPGTSPAPPAPTAPRPTQPTTRDEVGALLAETASAYGLDPTWVKALAWQESGWKQQVVSYAGAVGIMQVMPGTGQFVSSRLVGRPLDLSDARDNVEAGVAFIAHLLELTGGDMQQVLAGYYQGLGSVRRNGLRPDTVRYVANITALRERF